MIGSCPECNGKLSSEAATCPHCGYLQAVPPSVPPASPSAPQPLPAAPNSGLLDPKKNLTALWRLVVLVVLLLGVIAVVFGQQTCHRVVDATKGIVHTTTKAAEQAVMRPGTYTVQLDEVELHDGDWTKDSFSGKPKRVRMMVTIEKRTVVSEEIGAFRGKKLFNEKPIAFQVPYDGTTRITLRFEEVVLLSNGVTYTMEEEWPFALSRMGKASSCSFSWK